MTRPQPVLVMKMGGPAAFAEATPAMALIRQVHRGQRVVLVTGEDTADLGRAAPYFDDVVGVGDLTTSQGLGRAVIAVKSERPGRIYDLDGSSGVERIFAVMRPFSPEIAGTLRGATFKADMRKVDRLHPVDAIMARIAPAGLSLEGDPIPDVSWAVTARPNTPSMQPAFFGLTAPFVILAPGGEALPGRPVLPAAHFAGLSVRLTDSGVSVGLASTPEDRDAARAVARACPAVKDLAARADYTQAAALATQAVGVFGHVGAEMLHFLAAAGVPTIAITSPGEDPRAVPRGASVVALTADQNGDMTIEAAITAIGMFAGVDQLRASA